MKKDELTNQTPADAKPVLTAGGFTKQNFNHGQTY